MYLIPAWNCPCYPQSAARAAGRVRVAFATPGPNPCDRPAAPARPATRIVASESVSVSPRERQRERERVGGTEMESGEGERSLWQAGPAGLPGDSDFKFFSVGSARFGVRTGAIERDSASMSDMESQRGRAGEGDRPLCSEGPAGLAGDSDFKFLSDGSARFGVRHPTL